MDYDKEIMSRALQRAGQDELLDEDVTEKTAKYRAARDFYFPTLMLLLSEADWTELKKRSKLEAWEGENLSDYQYAYNIPGDMSRAISIDGGDAYEIEGQVLYTDVSDATLLYIRNGKRTELSELPAEKQDEEVYYDGKHWTWKEADEEKGTAAGYYEDEEQEDQPLYDELPLSPEFKQCFEYQLAAELSLKITGSQNLYQQLMQYAMAMQKRSQKTSREHATGKLQGHAWWSDTLGISSEEE